jgi:hypothetical protein
MRTLAVLVILGSFTFTALVHAQEAPSLAPDAPPGRARDVRSAARVLASAGIAGRLGEGVDLILTSARGASFPAWG